MNKKKRVLVQFALVAMVLLVGVLAMRVLMSLKKPPDTKDPEIFAPLLNAVKVSSETVQMAVSGYGTVQPRSHVQVVPQVSGRVIKCHDHWVDGGFFKAGEPLIKIEPVDYELAVQNAEATVTQAEVALQREQAEALTARAEWEKLHPGQEPPSALVLREPQIKNARAQLKAAQSKLEEAQLDLERTTITMPFDGRIVSTNIDTGQFVSTGAPVATVYRTDLMEITVPLENDELEWFQVPLSMNGGQNPGTSDFSPARVSTDFAGRQYTWPGQVVRIEGEIDPKSRLVPVVVQVTDPFAVTDGEVPLTPGMFVTVEIQGQQITDIVRVPRHAIRNGTQVWVAKEITGEPSSKTSGDPSENDENSQESVSEKLPKDARQLDIQTVQIIRMDKEYAYINEGLKDGAVVITSPLETVTNGMLVRVNLEGQSQTQGESL